MSADWRLVNYTGHPVTIRGDVSDVTIPVHGSARAAVSTDVWAEVEVEGSTVLVTAAKEVAVVGMPAPEPGVLVIVSKIVFDALPDRMDLVAPDRMIRRDGRVIACGTLRRHPL